MSDFSLPSAYARLALAMAASVAIHSAASAQSSRSGVYLYMRAADTLGTETLSVSDSAAVGVLQMRGQPRLEWTQFRSGTSMGTLRLQASTAPNAPPQLQALFNAQGDSIIADINNAGKSSTQRIPSKKGARPLINASVLHEVLLGANAQRLNATTIDFFLTSGGQTLPGTIAQRGDTLLLSVAGTELRVQFGADGLPSTITSSQNVRIVRSSILGSAATAPKLGYDAPPNAPYTAEHVRIPSGRGYDLAATLTRPRGVAKAPALITISGSGPQERDSRISLIPGYAFFREIADTLGRRGIAVLRFDDRGVGESGGRESAAKATSADFADDVRSIVRWLRARPDIDGSRILLAGHSEGGMIAPMVAVTDPQLRGIVLMAGPAYTGRRISLFQNRQTVDGIASLTPRQRDSIMTRVPAALDSAGNANPWLGYFFTHDPLVTARQVKQPVLILQGLTDRQVSPEQADTLAFAMRKTGNKTVTVRTFAATNHLFLPDSSGASTGYSALPDTHVRPTVLSALADWATKIVK